VRELAEVHAALPEDVRRQLRFLSVSVDPLQDTPASLAAFAKRLGADRPGWHFVTGAPAQVEQLLDRMQVMDSRKASPKPEDHRTSLYLFDAAGALVQRYGGNPVDRPRLVAEITQVARLPAAAIAAASRPPKLP
jgi:protein SCO1/2